MFVVAKASGSGRLFYCMRYAFNADKTLNKEFLSWSANLKDAILFETKTDASEKSLVIPNTSVYRVTVEPA